MANSLQYEKPNQDPIFQATTEISAQGQDIKRYLPKNPVTILGCADQHQFCEPSTSQCTDLLGARPVIKAAVKLPLNPHQDATMRYIWNAIYYNSIFFAVDTRGAGALQASESVYQNTQQSVSDTQWITEVQGWFNSSLARLQQAMVDTATGPLRPYSDILYTKPGTDPQIDLVSNLCNQQIIRSNGQFQNFDVLGIAIIFSLCTVFIFLSFVAGFIKPPVLR
jgi:hypothetical protein